jgi:hypothetical protein
MKIQFATALAVALVGAPALAQTPSYTPQTPNAQTSPTTPMTPGAQKAPMANQSASATPVTSLSDAKSKLASATVKDSQGTSIGQVKSVETGSGGMVQSVRVALSKGKRTVAIPASSLSFDSTSGTVQASMTQSEINALPKSSSTSY